MAYNKDFYKAYQAYLKEKDVRSAHDWIFHLFTYWNTNFGEEYRYDDVIDLGCGQFNEFRKHYDPFHYLGIDENANKIHNHIEGEYFTEIVKGNYRNRKLLKSLIGKTQEAFVSLFSSEVHASYKENYDLYNWIFKTFPNIRAGLVSGLYHSNKKDTNPMIANGNKIYQTVESIEDCHRIGYTEQRIVMEVPSKLFGKHEVEVWKIFKRI